jgi:hypothetical protein|tara:strand:+ start:72 stop:560 length:489 start_codon:yes stop_codon:yes gene_type:complete
LDAKIFFFVVKSTFCTSEPSPHKFQKHSTTFNNNTNTNDRPKLPIKMSSSLRSVNPNAESMDKAAALFMNINAAKGLQDVMRTNLGPRGTIKMLVDGAGGTHFSLLFLFYLFLFIRFFCRFVGMVISRFRYCDESSAEFPPAGEPASEKAIDLMRETCRRFV